MYRRGGSLLHQGELRGMVCRRRRLLVRVISGGDERFENWMAHLAPIGLLRCPEAAQGGTMAFVDAVA